MELALILPVFLMLVLGAVHFCLVMFGYCSASYACAMAGHYLAIHGAGSPSPCASVSALQSAVTPYLWGPAATATLTSTNSTWPPIPGQTVLLMMSFQYRVVIPFTNLTNINTGVSTTATILQ